MSDGRDIVGRFTGVRTGTRKSDDRDRREEEEEEDREEDVSEECVHRRGVRENEGESELLAPFINWAVVSADGRAKRDIAIAWKDDSTSSRNAH